MVYLTIAYSVSIFQWSDYITEVKNRPWACNQITLESEFKLLKALPSWINVPCIPLNEYLSHFNLTSFFILQTRRKQWSFEDKNTAGKAGNECYQEYKRGLMELSGMKENTFTDNMIKWSVNIQVPLTGYVGLIWWSSVSAVPLPLLQVFEYSRGYFEGTL